MSVKQLQSYIGVDNIAPKLTPELLAKIGSAVVTEFDIDVESRSEWERKSREAMDLAEMVSEEKSFPWPNAANVKYPLIISAVIDYAARAYAEIIKGNSVVKGKVTGFDPTGEKEDRAERIGKHMSYQLLEEMEEWEPEMDRLLHMHAVIGCMFKKTYFDSVLGRNVSTIIKPFDFVVNAKAKSLDTARRKTHVLELYRNEIVERVNAKLFDEVIIDRLNVNSSGADSDEDAAHEFLEQHRWWDMDDDGYQEPYIVTVHRESATVVRIVAGFDEDTVYLTERGTVSRIEQVQYFTKFPFIPNPTGDFYDWGFGQLLFHLNESINTTINQLLDAGTLANTQGGFLGKGIQIKGGQIRLGPGEWKQLNTTGQDLKSNIVPAPVGAPSTVLFQLLGFLVDTGRMLASMTDAKQGEANGANEPATTYLARIEQGMKVYNAIYKRTYKALKSEYRKLARLNKMYLDDEYYYRVLDAQEVAFRDDYEDKDCDVQPVADPNASTDIQRMAKAQALMDLHGRPYVDDFEIDKRYLDAIGVPNPEAILLEAKRQDSPPNPEVVKLEQEMKIKGEELRLKEEELDIRRAEMVLKDQEVMARIDNLKSASILNIAKAEAAEVGPQIQLYQATLDDMHRRLTMAVDMMTAQNSAQAAKEEGNEQPPDGGGMAGMEAPPVDEGLLQMLAGGEAGGGGNPDAMAGLGGEDGAIDGAEGGIPGGAGLGA